MKVRCEFMLTRFVGETLKSLRKKYRMTIPVLAEKTGIATSCVSRYETGLTDMSVDAVAKMCKVFDLRPSEFIAMAEGLELDYAKKVMADPRMRELLREIQR